MKTQSVEPLDFLSRLGPADALLAEARAAQPGPSTVLPFNTHIHLPPNFSAFSGVAQALELARGEDIAVLGVSNYYDFTIYRTFAEQACAAGIFPLFGTEIITLDRQLQESGTLVNDPGNPGKMYVCGKGITQFLSLSDKATEILRIIRRNDADRMREMVQRMKDAFATAGIQIALEDKDIIADVAQACGCDPKTVVLQERHLAQAFQQRFCEQIPPPQRPMALSNILGKKISDTDLRPVPMQNAIRSALMKAGKSCFVSEAFIDFEQARTLILEMGGVVCYPVLADGAEPICTYEASIDALIDDLQRRGVHMAELIPIRNRPDCLTEYVTRLRQAGIVVTAGTEHNTQDLIPVVPSCQLSEPLSPEVREIFWEGACVLIAHQVLTHQGHCGYTDRQGNLNDDFTAAEERIAAFARLGAALLEQFRS